MEPKRLYLPGRDISRWPQMKLARANELFLQLRSEIETWSTSGAVVCTPILIDDGTRIELRLSVKSGIPIDVWSMRLGEAIHQLRASFDALAWDLAHVDGATPPNEGRIYFPAHKKERAWVEAKKDTLSTIPADVLQRLEDLQLFQDYAADGRALLEVLNSLDNRDKHRGLLDGKAVLAAVQMDGLSFEFVNDGDAVLNLAKREGALQIADGAHAGTINLSGPIKAETFAATELAVGVEFVIEQDGNVYRLTDLATALVSLSASVQRAICGFPIESDPEIPSELAVVSLDTSQAAGRA